ncbi:hypothetical protein ANN_08867 [Periplaneta americana]|uniref:Uncharacterized protein n=1 Tax=Periplaneta americana TaxID=6978 RepID=A0ABQ8T3T5_PERAM|nr:hypothetical protein ANN_08867 [Periplaneta americana]
MLRPEDVARTAALIDDGRILRHSCCHSLLCKRIGTDGELGGNEPPGSVKAQLEEYLVTLWTDPGADMNARRLKPLPTSKVSVTEVYSSEVPDIIMFDP